MQAEKLYLSKKSRLYVTKVHTCNDPAILVTVGCHLPPCSDNVHCMNKRNKNASGLRNLSNTKMSEENSNIYRGEKKCHPITL